MVCSNSSGRDVEKPVWQGGWASARFREFGNFQLVEDTIAPVITPIGISDGADLSHSGRIAFTVKDNLGTIRNFRAELDPPGAGQAMPGAGQVAAVPGQAAPVARQAPPVEGREGQWLCFSHDKEQAFIYTFDGHCPPGQHVLKVTVEDVAGNRATGVYRFTR